MKINKDKTGFILIMAAAMADIMGITYALYLRPPTFDGINNAFHGYPLANTTYIIYVLLIVICGMYYAYGHKLRDMIKDDMKHKIISLGIIFMTFASLFPLLFVRLEGYQATLFWLYSFLITSFLICMYAITDTYKPMSDVGHRPNISVIIPSKDEEGAIQKTILSVLRSDYPTDKLEVIVVDDGSTDHTSEKIIELQKTLKNDKIILIKHETNRGKRMAFYSGVKRSNGEILVCIDSDTCVDKDALKLLVQPFVKKEIMASCGHGKVSNKDGSFLAKLQHYWYQEMFYLTKGMEAKFGAVTCCSGILAAYRREVIFAVMDEWLNEKFMGHSILIGDDRQLTNLSLRGIEGIAKDKNSEFIFSTSKSEVTYQSNAIVYTIAPDSFKQFLKQQLRWKRAWVHGTMLASSFMWKKPFPVPIFFYAYQVLTYVNPIIIFVWMIYKPLQGEWLGTFGFVIGSLYIGILHGLNVYRIDNDSENVIYRMTFVFMSMFLSVFLIPYARLTIWKGGWVTRGETSNKGAVSIKEGVTI